ncbi:MAG: hypothetical protein AAF674_16610 [Pseudomonadota bacterium]
MPADFVKPASDRLTTEVASRAAPLFPHDGMVLSDKSRQNWRPGGLTDAEAQRRHLADCIWTAWPAASMTACSDLAAEELGSLGFKVTARHLRRVLSANDMDVNVNFVLANAIYALAGQRRVPE